MLNDTGVADGRYAYGACRVLPQLVELQGDTAQANVNQFGVDYYGDLARAAYASHSMAPTVSLAGAAPREGRAMWWSNRGDDSVAT